MPYATAEDVEAYAPMLNFDELTINTEPSDTGVAPISDNGDTGVYDLGDTGVTISTDTGVGGAGMMGDDVITVNCYAQSSLIDSYLCGRYTTPITGPATVLSVLRTHCSRLVIYSLFQGRLLADSYQTLQEDRDITLEWLRGVAAGKYSIPGQTPPPAPSQTSTDLIGGSDTQVFGPSAPDTLPSGIWL